VITKKPFKQQGKAFVHGFSLPRETCRSSRPRSRCVASFKVKSNMEKNVGNFEPFIIDSTDKQTYWKLAPTKKASMLYNILYGKYPSEFCILDSEYWGPLTPPPLPPLLEECPQVEARDRGPDGPVPPCWPFSSWLSTTDKLRKNPSRCSGPS
jgi:hypothetical protein